MKKFLMTLMVAVFAVGAMSAQTVKNTKAPIKQVAVEKKHECKDHKDGQPCTKPADQQCDDCKAKAAAPQKLQRNKAEGQQCKKAEGMKHECKEGKKECDKAAGMKHECKEGKKECDKAAAETKDCCKDKKMEGKKCDKPADQQCPDCKEAAKKN